MVNNTAAVSEMIPEGLVRPYQRGADAWCADVNPQEYPGAGIVLY